MRPARDVELIVPLVDGNCRENRDNLVDEVAFVRRRRFAEIRTDDGWKRVDRLVREGTSDQ